MTKATPHFPCPDHDNYIARLDDTPLIPGWGGGAFKVDLCDVKGSMTDRHSDVQASQGHTARPFHYQNKKKERKAIKENLGGECSLEVDLSFTHAKALGSMLRKKEEERKG